MDKGLRRVLAGLFRPMGALAPTAATAAAMGVLLGPSVAQAAERRMTGEELRDIARREMLWCENYVAATDDCDVVTLVRLTSDGRLAETSTLLLQEEPRLQVYIGDQDRIDGDRLCSTIEASRTAFYFTVEGQPAPAATALGLRLLFMAQLAELDGKTLCQTFFRDEATGVVREEITVDDQRRQDLESTYVLREGSERLKLRPQSTPTESNARTQV